MFAISHEDYVQRITATVASYLGIEKLSLFGDLHEYWMVIRGLKAICVTRTNQRKRVFVVRMETFKELPWDNSLDLLERSLLKPDFTTMESTVPSSLGRGDDSCIVYYRTWFATADLSFFGNGVPDCEIAIQFDALFPNLAFASVAWDKLSALNKDDTRSPSILEAMTYFRRDQGS